MTAIEKSDKLICGIRWLICKRQDLMNGIISGYRVGLFESRMLLPHFIRVFFAITGLIGDYYVNRVIKINQLASD